MGNIFLGSGSAGLNDGSSWANRLGSLSAAELKVTAGSIVYVGPGTYRETLTCGSSGSLIYNTGIVNVTNQSATVTGVTTSFSGVVNTNCIFWITQLSHGTDGSMVSASGIFNANLGNFQAGHIGQTIRINTIGAFIVNIVNSASQIGVMNPDLTSASSFASASGLTYDIGPEQPYEITSVDSNTQITLKQNWSGPTLTGLPYIVYNPIRYIADITGAMTDGVGGVVRVTGSNSPDQTYTRGYCINLSGKSYRLFQGFNFDGSSSQNIIATASTSTNIMFLDCGFDSPSNEAVYCSVTASINWLFLRCTFKCHYAYACVHINTVFDNTAWLFINCYIVAGYYGFEFSKAGGAIIKNCFFIGLRNYAVIADIALTIGQAITVNNSIIDHCNFGFGATVQITNEVIENYNNIYASANSRNKVTIGVNSQIYPTLPNQFIQYPGFLYPNLLPFSLSPQSSIRAITDFNAPNDDFYGMMRPTTNGKRSWGAIQYQPTSRSSVQAHGGTYSLCLSDAGRTQMIVPTTNTSTTFSVYVYRETNYAGTNPQLIIKQPYQSDVTITDTSGSGTWNLLSTTLVPAALPNYTVMEMVSNNSASAGSYNVYFDDVTVQ